MSNKTECNENQIKHLEMIENVIERMAQNSFALKGWAMTLVAAICALATAGSEHRFVVVALIPILIFWFLDAFYLQKERKYRELFNKARAEDLNFSMDTEGLSGKKTRYIRCLFSVSEWVFYFSILAGVAALTIWLKLL